MDTVNCKNDFIVTGKPFRDLVIIKAVSHTILTHHIFPAFQ